MCVPAKTGTRNLYAFIVFFFQASYRSSFLHSNFIPNITVMSTNQNENFILSISETYYHTRAMLRLSRIPATSALISPA